MAGRIGVILARRAVFLTLTLVLVVFFTALMIGVTGYDKRIWEAIIHEQVRAYQQALMQRNVPNVHELVEEYRQKLIEIYGLDKPWYVRLLPLALHTLMFDFGDVMLDEVASLAGLQWPARVSDVILIVLPRTIIMLTVAELICAFIALPFAPRIAYKRGSAMDKAIVTYAAVFNAIPVWWFGMLLIFLFGYILRIAPTDYFAVASILSRFWKNPVENLINLMYYSYLPILTVVITFLGNWLYIIRAVSLRVVAEDFVRVAQAKGLPDNLIAKRYVLRVVAGPVATYAILSLAASIGGFIITESVFHWPGMGTLYYVSIVGGDVPTIFGLIYVTTLVYIIARFVLEVLQVILDPRVRY